MSKFAYTLLGLTAIVAALVGVLAFAVARFIAAAREVRRQSHGGERAFVSSALEDAVVRLKTQERAMTARAEESERLSDQIMASMNSGLIVVGVDGGVRVVNPAAARLLALPETAGDPYRSVLASAPPLADLIERCLVTGETLARHTVEVDDAEKGVRHYGVGVSPLRDGQGGLRGAICLFTDLTSVVALEEQVRLKESLARLGELTAGLAHEFRNGLATIHGYGRLLDPDKVPAEYRPYVEGIREETEALGHVVTNFLAFAKPAALVRDAVDLRDVAESAAEEVADEVAARGGTLTIEGHFGGVNGDLMLLRQAVSNLLRNALEACQQASVAPLIRVAGEVQAAQGVARISVIDNGPGVPHAARARLFTPFFTTKPTGTGLGLALVQKIVVSHDGRVGVGAPVGGGACFEIDLPLAAAPFSPQT